FSQIWNCENDPPIVKLCDPLSQVTVSSAVTSVALRDEGEVVPPRAVKSEPTVGKLSWKPFVFATSPLSMSTLICLKNCTGAPLAPTRASFTRLRPSVERSELLKAMRVESCPALIGKSGKKLSRFLNGAAWLWNCCQLYEPDSRWFCVKL